MKQEELVRKLHSFVFDREIRSSREMARWRQRERPRRRDSPTKARAANANSNTNSASCSNPTTTIYSKVSFSLFVLFRLCGDTCLWIRCAVVLVGDSRVGKSVRSSIDSNSYCCWRLLYCAQQFLKRFVVQTFDDEWFACTQFIGSFTQSEWRFRHKRKPTIGAEFESRQMNYDNKIVIALQTIFVSI